jgi:serine/threonine-protein kinase RsbW
MTATLDVTLANRLDEVGRIIDLVEAFAVEHRLGDDIAYAFSLGLDEVVSNVVKYAYDDSSHHDIAVTLRLGGGWLRAEVRDDGRAFDPLQAPAPDLDAPIEERPIGGLGIHIVRAMMDAVEYRRENGQNVLALAKRIA